MEMREVVNEERQDMTMTAKGNPRISIVLREYNQFSPQNLLELRAWLKVPALTKVTTPSRNEAL